MFVVVERRDDDLVALAGARARERATQKEVEGGHARTEGDRVRRAAEERGGALVAALDDLVRRAVVGRADVGGSNGADSAKIALMTSSGH